VALVSLLVGGCKGFYRLQALLSVRLDVDNFGKISGGDALNEYMFFLFKNNSMVLDLVNGDLGSAGVESDTAGDGGSGGGGDGGSGVALLRSAGRVN